MKTLKYIIKPEYIKSISGLNTKQLYTDLSYCHPAIKNVISIDIKKGRIALQIDTDKTLNDYDIISQVDLVVKQTVKSIRFIRKREPVWAYNSKHQYLGSNEDLLKFCKKYITVLGPGQYAMSGLAYKLRSFFQHKFIAIANELGAEFWHLPSIEMVEGLTLNTGYLSSHPQLVTFGYHLPPHYEKTSKFSQIASKKDYKKLLELDLLINTGFILEPVVCHNVYRALSGTRMSTPRIISAEGNCYRYEGFRFEELQCQWEFTMREIIFFGPKDYQKTQRVRCINLIKKLVADLDLTGCLKVAIDPFFISAASSNIAFQSLYETKLELDLHIDDKRSVAGASFNLHGTHFTKEMDICDADNNLVETACVGFGIERWIAAFIARYSSKIDSWNESIKNEIFT